MDHLLSLLNRITALLEEWQRGQGVTLRPSSLSILRSIVATYCKLIVALSLDTELRPPQEVNSLGGVQLRLWEGFKGGKWPYSEVSEEEVEEDVLSLPDSLPDLIEEEEGEGKLPSVRYSK